MAVSEMEKLKFSLRSNELKFSIDRYDFMSAYRFRFSPFASEDNEKHRNVSEPENFPKLSPSMVPTLVKFIDGKLFSTDSGYSAVFGQSDKSPIELDENGKFSVFENLFKLVPDLQGRDRKARFYALQEALSNSKNFEKPISETVSLNLLILA